MGVRRQPKGRERESAGRRSASSFCGVRRVGSGTVSRLHGAQSKPFNDAVPRGTLRPPLSAPRQKFLRTSPITSVLALAAKKISIFRKNFLHLPEIPVISQLRTNFAEMPGKTQPPGSREQDFQGRRGGESESLEEEDIGIGNCNRSSQPSTVGL